MPFLLAALSGVCMAVQGALNGALGKIIGLFETTFIVHLIGTIVVGIFLFGFQFQKENWQMTLGAPWYTYLGGVISIFIIYLVAASIPKIGVANATTAIILGQVLTAGCIDYLGLFQLEKISFGYLQIIGVIFLVIGAKLLIH